MKKGIALIAGATIAALATPAMAQSASDFSGLRIGAEVGYDKLRSGSTADADTSRDLKQSIDGVGYGAVVGYDFPATNDVRVGVEASIADSSASWDNNNEDPNVFNLGRVQADRDIYVGARVGYVTNPKTMVYLKGGYTNARFGIEGRDGTASATRRLDTDGYRIGGGIEYAVTPNAYIGAEYRYSNYSEGEIDFNEDIADSGRFDIDTDRHQVMATVGYRF